MSTSPDRRSLEALAYRKRSKGKDEPVYVWRVQGPTLDDAITNATAALLVADKWLRLADHMVKHHFTKTEESSQINTETDDTTVAAIRRLYECGMTEVELAKQFGISQSNVSDIVRGYIWAAS